MCVFACVCLRAISFSVLSENPTDVAPLSRRAETFSMIYSNCCDGPIVSLCDGSGRAAAAEGGERTGGRQTEGRETGSVCSATVSGV